MRTKNIFRSFLAALTVLASLAMFGGVACKSDDSSEKADDTDDTNKKAATPAATYTTRGMVKGISDDRINIHHEPIEAFVDSQGKTVGMMSMSMPFAKGKGLALGELAAGSPVEFTFTVDFGQNPAGTVTAVSPLPKETTLNLSGM